ncbi:hypothetical protein D9M72_155270 [compost metagenome]
MAPISDVLPPDCRPSTLPAVTVLVVQLVSLPSALPRAALAATFRVKPTPCEPRVTPTPMLALLLLFVLCCSNVFCAACSRMSPSALIAALLPADRFDPVTVTLDARPPPCATMVRSRPAATVEPLTDEDSRFVALWLLLEPRLILMLRPPAAPGSAWIASYALDAARPVVASANPCMTLLSVLPAASPMRPAVRMALTSGVLALTLSPLCLTSWNSFSRAVSISAPIFTSRPIKVRSP